MTIYSTVLACRIPWTEEPGELRSMGCKELDMTEQLTLSQSLPWPLQSLSRLFLKDNLKESCKKYSCKTSYIEVVENIKHDFSSGPRGEICLILLFPSLMWMPKVSRRVVLFSRGEVLAWVFIVASFLDHVLFLLIIPISIQKSSEILLTCANLSTWEFVSVHIFKCMLDLKWSKY